MRKSLTIALALFLSSVLTGKDFGGVVSLDTTVHDFGVIALDGGPVSCEFAVTNISRTGVYITSVVSSCGCTDVKWTRAEMKPGEKGKITATYKNEDGAFPFDKTVTAYISGLSKPIVLHLRGVVKENVSSNAGAYPLHYGSLAVRSGEINAGNMSQGETLDGEVTVANIGKSRISLSFCEVTEGLTLKAEPPTIEPGKTGKIRYSISSSRDKWGLNWYYATPLVNGKKRSSSGNPAKEPQVLGAQTIVRDKNAVLAPGSTKIGFRAVTKEDFTSMSRSAAGNGPVPEFASGTSYAYGSIRPGTGIKASFRIRNTGKSTLRFYKIDCETSRVSISPQCLSVEPGCESSIRCTIDTRGLGAGENMFILNAYTNSPSRQIVYLYISGIIR